MMNIDGQSALMNKTGRSNSLFCRLFGHRYFVIKAFSPTTRKVGCKRCKRTWGMNDRVQTLVDWDGELEEFHNGSRCRNTDANK
jgi:hypothetical protein